MSNTMHADEIDAVLSCPLSRELLARDLTRLAYVAKDGTPRNIPIAFTWNGSQVVMCTTPNSPKLISLRHNPAVALTIDTEVHSSRPTGCSSSGSTWSATRCSRSMPTARAVSRASSGSTRPTSAQPSSRPSGSAPPAESRSRTQPIRRAPWRARARR